MKDDVHFTNNNHPREDMDITWYISLFITNLEISRDAVCGNCALLAGVIKHQLKGLKISYYKGL